MGLFFILLLLFGLILLGMKVKAVQEVKAINKKANLFKILSTERLRLLDQLLGDEKIEYEVINVAQNEELRVQQLRELMNQRGKEMQSEITDCLQTWKQNPNNAIQNQLIAVNNRLIALDDLHKQHKIKYNHMLKQWGFVRRILKLKLAN